ncbi:cation:proton antiporter [Actinomyces radicidentis]|uniref:Cation/H+ exchanger transmembrane domain-containing protein n=1 Tax=Actinomyces radicidentis TaxID=111015 RepID=A0A0X8JG30_ACTRD|nr:cation:proton antiporter [Actinomyces radicidentis]AMD87748.1 hypothetical protein AXF14_09310 [Actinomyces radicidentis]
MQTLVFAVAGILAVVASNQLAPCVGVASPLLLLALGIAAGLTPWGSGLTVDPEVILEVVLPALLFSTAASLPVMDFRREVVAVSGLAIGLVLATAVLLGLVLDALVPALTLPWAIALAAVISPTDAVAVSIARGSGVGRRVITVLEGEGLFNDATALVLLSSATTAGLAHDAGELSPASLLPDFLLALLVAVVIGWAVGELAVRARSRVLRAPMDTALTFTVPFLASVPAEHLGGSGLVAAVVAGLVMSYRGPRLLPPSYRQAGDRNWQTIELLLEGLVFLTMGVQAHGILIEVEHEGLGAGTAALVAVVAAVVTIAVRAVFVAGLIPGLRLVGRGRRRRHAVHADSVARMEERLAALSSDAPEDAEGAEGADGGEAPEEPAAPTDGEEPAPAHAATEPAGATGTDPLGRDLRRERRRKRRLGADLEYFRNEPLRWREGTVIVWAGMRGAITLAAAQTLPTATPERPFLMLVALVVAAGSLTLQGLTLPWVIARVRPAMASSETDREERDRLVRLLASAAKSTALSDAIAEHASDEDGPQRVTGVMTGWSTVGRVLHHHHGVGDPAEAAEATLAEPGSSGHDAAAEQTVDEELEADREAARSGSGKAAGALDAAHVRELAIDAIREQRDAILDARDEGVFSSDTLAYALARLDAEQIMLETHR